MYEKLSAVSLLLATTLILSGAVSCLSPPSQQKSNEVLAIWNRLLIYPGIVEVSGGSTASGFDKAYTSKHFKGPPEYLQVKQFYVDQLAKEGWHVSTERQLKSFNGEFSGEMQLEFRRGEFEITIDYAPEGLDYGWNYAITVSWLLKVAQS